MKDNNYCFGTKAKAMGAAKRVLSKMKTKGWTIRVHYNLGWFFNLQRGPLRLYYHYGKFSALLSTDNSGGGEAFWTERNFYHEDPNVVVDRQLALAWAHVDECQKAIKEASDERA